MGVLRPGERRRGPESHFYSKSAGDKAGPICQIGGQSCKFQRLALAAMPDDLMGKFNVGRTTADGCREQPLLSAILHEANVWLSGRRPPARGTSRRLCRRAAQATGYTAPHFADDQRSSISPVGNTPGVSQRPTARVRQAKRTFLQDRKSTRLNSSHSRASRMPSSA